MAPDLLAIDLLAHYLEQPRFRRQGTSPMLIQLLIIFTTAALSSVFTLAAAYFLYQRRIRQRIEQAVEEKLAEVEVRLGDLLESRVSQGVVKGVAAIPSKEMLRDTTRSVARTGVELVEEGLSTFLGRGRRRKP
jgi:hypothetical protein